MIKTIIVFLNFALKCRLVSKTCAIALMQAGMQANQLASAIDRVGNITNFPENRANKSFFFSLDSKETCSLIFSSVIKKVCQENISFVKTMDMYVFIKGIIGKANCDLHVRFFCKKKQNNFEHVLYPLLKKRGEKIYLKKWIVAGRPQSNYRFEGGLHRRTFLKINTTFNTHVILAVFYRVY